VNFRKTLLAPKEKGKQVFHIFLKKGYHFLVGQVGWIMRRQR
jgi:hypothetical protein